MNQILTQERLKEVLDYNPETGVFRWKVRRSRTLAGTIAGSRHSGGYINIRLDRINYRAHRLAWLHEFGSFPPFQLDHKNCVKDDNRLENLREATLSDQQANSKGRREGFKGCRRTPQKKWAAQISKNGLRVHLGTFDTEEIAHYAYAAAARILFGEFARVA